MIVLRHTIIGRALRCRRSGGHVTWPNTAHPTERPVPLSPYQQCRLLLSHLNYLPFDQRKIFNMLRVDEKFYRSLASLDKILPREIVKIGLIYVQKGQDDQRVILRNDSKSPLYQDFVNGLAWRVDVGMHRGTHFCHVVCVYVARIRCSRIVNQATSAVSTAACPTAP